MASLKKLLFSKLGPETDPKKLARSELFKSSAIYLAMGLASAVIVVIVETVSPTGDIWKPRWEMTGQTSPIAFALTALFSLGAIGGLSGGLYLFVRALFKRRNG